MTPATLLHEPKSELLKEGYIGDYMGDHSGGCEGDTRSLV